MSRLVIIAPGRGSYNRTELQYLQRHADHPAFPLRRELAELADSNRTSLGRTSVSELDNAERYSQRVHLPGENASALIFTCAAADMKTLAAEHDVVGVLGNSMGWYTTLFTGGALSFEDAFRVVDTMGWFQKGNIQGGQIIYPIIDDQWRMDPEREADAMAVVNDVAGRGESHWVGLSIRLGGFLVLAGASAGIKCLLDELPKVKVGANEYPFQLARHAAFHTHLMKEASNHGRAELKNISWGQPTIPMIDGRGHVWRPYRSDPGDLLDYTLRTQVLEPYDFSASVRVALREMNPDHLVLLGPGETLGGSIAHVMIDEGWRGIDSKKAFVEAQKSDAPPLIAMNRLDQAARVI